MSTNEQEIPEMPERQQLSPVEELAAKVAVLCDQWCQQRATNGYNDGYSMVCKILEQLEATSVLESYSATKPDEMSLHEHVAIHRNRIMAKLLEQCADFVYSQRDVKWGDSYLLNCCHRLKGLTDYNNSFKFLVMESFALLITFKLRRSLNKMRCALLLATDSMSKHHLMGQKVEEIEEINEELLSTDWQPLFRLVLDAQSLIQFLCP